MSYLDDTEWVRTSGHAWSLQLPSGLVLGWAAKQTSVAEEWKWRAFGAFGGVVGEGRSPSFKKARTAVMEVLRERERQ